MGWYIPLSEEIQERVLREHRNRVQSDPDPAVKFPTQGLGNGNLARRRREKKKFEQVVKIICGAQRRKVWKQLKKDFQNIKEQHLKVA